MREKNCRAGMAIGLPAGFPSTGLALTCGKGGDIDIAASQKVFALKVPEIADELPFPHHQVWGGGISPGESALVQPPPDGVSCIPDLPRTPDTVVIYRFIYVPTACNDPRQVVPLFCSGTGMVGVVAYHAIIFLLLRLRALFLYAKVLFLSVHSTPIPLYPDRFSRD